MRKLKLEELNRVSIPEFKAQEKHPVYIVLDNIRSGLNVGSVFRTADAFAIKEILLTGICPQPPHKEIHKSAIGATASVEWRYFEKVEDAIYDLKKDGVRVLGVEQTDESISLQKGFDKDQGAIALVFGNEVNGLSDAVLPLLDDSIEVPQFGTKHSLNISVCAGILMWESVKPHMNGG